VQEPGVAFTVSGSTITFATAPLGIRISNNQEVEAQKFVGRMIRFKNESLNNQYFKKIKNIQEEFNGVENRFQLYYEDGTEAILDAKERGLSEIKVGTESYNVEESWKQFEEEEMCEGGCGDGPMDEELTGNQEKIDADNDGEITANDFDILRDKKELNEGEGMCNECGSPMNEEGECNECSTMKEEDETVVTSMDDLGEEDEEVITSLDQLGESKKATLRLSESELVSLISRMVSESVPGLEFTKKAQKVSGDDSKSHMSDVEKKLKDISTFNGNDNPEFPNQINKGEKVAQRTTDEENETIEDNRGGGMEDLNYDYEPSEKFKVRLKKL
jgi:hypothetical protein